VRIRVNAGFGCSIGTAGDVNGDGYSDLLVGARYWESGSTENAEGAVFVYHGSARGSQPYRTSFFNPTTPMTTSVPTWRGWDINNDGYSDIIVGAYTAAYSPNPPASQEGASLFSLGSATGLPAAPVHRLERM
jgi:hypothetical protein